MKIKSRWLLIILVLGAIFNVASFYAPHSEGDEVTYLTISRYMDWNLSSYTTRFYDPVRSYPNKLFRADIFLHPPLFPWILKVGWTLESPVLIGLLFNTATKIIVSVLVYCICLQLRVGQIPSFVAGMMVAMDPVLGFISSRLLTDIYLTLGIILTLFVLIRGVVKHSLGNLILASFCFCVALNSKFQAVIFLPLFFMAWSYCCWVICKAAPSAQSRIFFTAASSLAILIVFGLFHFIRLYFAYGIAGVYDLIYTIEVPLNQFVLRMERRSIFPMICYLLVLQPWILILFAPTSLNTVIKNLKARPEILILCGFIIYTILAVSFSPFQQERYWAPVFPLLAVVLMFVLDSELKLKPRWFASWKVSALAASFAVMVLTNYTTNVLTAGVATAEVIPIVLHVFPFLRLEGSPFCGF